MKEVIGIGTSIKTYSFLLLLLILGSSDTETSCPQLPASERDSAVQQTSFDPEVRYLLREVAAW